MTTEEFKDEYDARDDFETQSAGDYTAELTEKIATKGNKTPPLGFFEKNPYYDRIFPSLTI